MPGPVLYGSVIDSTCILWGRKCDKKTSCQYYDLDRFRQRFLGLQVVFVCGALLCFLLTIVVLRRRAGQMEGKGVRGGYAMVSASSKEKELEGIKT
ncbi:solute carrier organic anion transporter family member 2B1-like [Notothenia coriiceps]|uniref:Solute carrier organic anion transporter family member 2B1-like n=1 Tax=Notothenia coriiceps TaxID=8208 RepID=A0A6I9NLB6_9TELE|nr:PREDICTED: solute carrier organic anion transporter family member 2B1-like [Notothenia coriiceps]